MIRRYRVARVLALMVAAASGVACRQGDATPRDVVVQFYTMRDALGVDGAPRATELTALRPFITDSLAQGLASADSLRIADMQRAPDEKPAFVEGDLFSSLFEGATGMTASAPVATGDVQLVPVTFTNDQEKPAVSWMDTVVVRKENGRWLVHDVRYGGTWAFANKGSLLRSLPMKRDSTTR